MKCITKTEERKYLCSPQMTPMSTAKPKPDTSKRNVQMCLGSRVLGAAPQSSSTTISRADLFRRIREVQAVNKLNNRRWQADPGGSDKGVPFWNLARTVFSNENNTPIKANHRSNIYNNLQRKRENVSSNPANHIQMWQPNKTHIHRYTERDAPPPISDALAALGMTRRSAGPAARRRTAYPGRPS